MFSSLIEDDDPLGACLAGINRFLLFRLDSYFKVQKKEHEVYITFYLLCLD